MIERVNQERRRNVARNARRVAEDGVIRIDTRNKWFNISLILACFFVLLGVRLQVNNPTTGDEPHYLIMDYALVHDHSLNLKEVYTKDEYLSFYPVRGLPPQGNKKVDSLKSQKIYSPHGIGVPLLLYPGFLLASKNGAVFEMVMLSTLVVCLSWWWTFLVTGNRKAAYLAASILAVSYFFNGLSGYIFPDIPIAGATLAALIILERYFKGVLPQIIFGLLMGLLIFLHIKDLVIVFPLLLALSYKLWRTNRQLPWIAGMITSAFFAYYLLTLHQWFGVWNPSVAYGSGVNFGGNILSNVSAMLFDSSRGLLIYSPVMLLIFVGVPLWIKKRLSTFLVAIIATAPSMLVLADFNQWNGGEAEIGRYIIDFLPVYIPAIAFAIERLNAAWQRACIGLLALITFLVSLDATMSRFPMIDAGAFFTRPTLFSQIQRHTGLAIDHLIPTYTTQTQVTVLLSNHGSIKLLLGYVVVAILICYGIFMARKLPPKNPNGPGRMLS